MKRWMPVLLIAGGGYALAKMFQKRPPADLRGQVVLITGGSRGFGLALAREFGRHGCKIAICARDANELETASDWLHSEGFECFFKTCDVTNRDQVQELMNSVRDRYGRIDILVNNAGEILVAPVENTTQHDFQHALDVMFWGVLHPTFLVLPEMQRRGSGRIATITSIGGKVSVPHLLPYSCAKAAAVAFCEGLRAEVANKGVIVTTIAPSLMRTGSHVQASFKGQVQKEANWFSVAATMPGISMSAEQAAAEAFEAIRDGRAERILSKQADLLSRIHGLFPEFLPNLFAVVNRMLPSATEDTRTEVKARDLQQNPILQGLTLLGRLAGARLNQGPTPAS